MRVLRVAHHAPVSAWRQRERELRLLGVDLTLISAKRWNGGGRIVRLEPGEDTFVRGARTIGTHPSVFLFDPLPIWRALGEGPDLIDLHEEPNALATAEVLTLRWLRRSRAPYVLYSAQNIRKTYPFPFRMFERLSLRGASAAYVCNREAGEILNDKGLAGRAVYLPLGVDLDAFGAADRPPPAAHAVIGYIGRLEPHKGVDVLLDAIAPHPEWTLRITGDGSERKELTDRAKELGIEHRVEFLGFTDGAGLGARYRELDVLAVPSRPTPGWREQFGRVVVEGMASGVPVVASASGALPEVVGEAGVLCSPDDPADLARALATALEPRRWAELREAGLERAPLFAWSRVAEAQERLYDRIVRRSNEEISRRPLCVLIVAFGPPDDLDGCLATLDGSFPVIVVDNSGLSETRLVAERHGARYVDAKRNRGFAAGVNLGLRTVQGEDEDMDVLLLNPDARITADQVELMSAKLRSSSRTAAVGARQFVPGTTAPVRVWWPFPTPLGAWAVAVGLGRLHMRHGFAIGSVLLLRSEALKDVGWLDERFFLYAEETDWQLRARQRGWLIDVADATAMHEGGGASEDPREREWHFYTSLRTFMLKHHGPRGWESFRLANLFGARLRAAVSTGTRRAAALRRRDLFTKDGLDEANRPA
ncbi:MAG TPA: glycosyltransferase [Lacisediminihabitans sp.]|uniref:glycosyltransferase n=1 Tax=Lacisediminihabitans sp. TaxID=2787631 RepID=UPI002ED842B7